MGTRPTSPANKSTAPKPLANVLITATGLPPGLRHLATGFGCGRILDLSRRMNFGINSSRERPIRKREQLSTIFVALA